MSEKISWSLTVGVAGGPTFKSSRTISVDAYDKLVVNVPHEAENQEVQVQPGAAERVKLLLIRSSAYSEQLTYRVNDATADARPLDEEAALLGSRVVGMLGADPKSLFFSNNTGAAVQIEILAARTATA